MITQQQALDTFEYREGKLYWKVMKSIRIKVGDEAGACDGLGYRVIRFNGKLYRTHHLVYLMHKGYLPKLLDHINRNRSDNRIENLREATASQNACNRPAKGVYWKSQIKHWCVEIQVNKVKHYFGIFKDFELAELVAKMAREKLHGQFAYKE
jgi:hypothetical protein